MANRKGVVNVLYHGFSLRSGEGVQLAFWRKVKVKWFAADQAEPPHQGTASNCLFIQFWQWAENLFSPCVSTLENLFYLYC